MHLLCTFLELVNPIKPEHIMFKNITTNSAIIQWTVSYISYSPETYVVKYGTSQDTLIQNSSTIYSGDDITITNMTYSVKLSNLKENTTYYVQVVATNTALRSNTSSVERFTTLWLESGKSVLLHEACSDCHTYLSSCHQLFKDVCAGFDRQQ